MFQFGCSQDFPAGTPLRHFFAWNERARRPDRRWRVARDFDRILPLLAGNAAAGRLAASLAAARGNPDPAAHAAVFTGFEALGQVADLAALAHRRVRPPRHAPTRRILVIRLGAFGDFVQSLGPFAAIRRHHDADHVTLLTTPPFADFARALGCIDAVVTDHRPRRLDLAGWLALRRALQAGKFDRVYDLQTSQRSGFYRRLLLPSLPEWSGIAAGCSHPHANPDRDRQHTLDRQAEQLLMAGVYPTPSPRLPAFASPSPALPDKPVVLLAPGSSPHRPAKRWPASGFGEVARALAEAGMMPVVVGTGAEQELAAAIRAICPAAIDLTGRTDLAGLAGLSQRAALTIGNDNGASHLAAAAGCPLVVLFSAASDPSRCAPRGGSVRVVAMPDLAALPAVTVLEAALATARIAAPVMA